MVKSYLLSVHYMQALCEMHYVHSLQMRKRAFRNEMPQKKDRWCWKISKKYKRPLPLGSLLGMVGHGHLTQNED